MKVALKDSPGPVFGRRDPDARGYFGEFGGRFVPETLVAPVEELSAAYFAARSDPAFRARAARAAGVLRRAGRRRSTSAGGAIGRSGVRLFLKREDLAHTGAHKINNALGQALLARAHGQAAGRRRNRRGPARRRDGHRVRAARPRLRRLHGRRGHGASGAQRLSHARARRHGRARRRRQPDAEGRHQRGDARLGRQRRATRTTCSAPCWARIRIR